MLPWNVGEHGEEEEEDKSPHIPADDALSYPPLPPRRTQPYNAWDLPHKYEGDGGMDHIKMLKISYADYSKRPARKQIEQSQVKQLQAPEGCNEYNIWYDRYLGEQWSHGKELVAAEYRCCVRRDSGRTKADSRHGEAAYCCIFFARGACVNGPDCTFLHRVPKPEDDKKLPELRDIFGRERYSTDRDDMRGVGNFNRMNKTLYVGGVKMLRGAEATHKSLLRHFSEWGHVDQLRLIPSKCIAFVTYTLRACAEFALEAMHCQTLDNDDLLNIRWAYDDPNPRAKQLAEERLRDQFMEHMKEHVTSIPDAKYEYPTDYQAPAAKRLKGEEGDAISAYPDTDAQYAYDYLAMGMESTTSSSTMAHAPGDDASFGGMVTIGPQGPQSREQADR